MSEIPVNKTKCPKCGADLNIHAPQIVTHHDAKMTQVSLIPSWSMDERICPGCKCLVAPRIKNVDIEIVAYEAAKETPRIVQPGPLPMDFERKLRGLR